MFKQTTVNTFINCHIIGSCRDQWRAPDEDVCVMIWKRLYVVDMVKVEYTKLTISDWLTWGVREYQILKGMPLVAMQLWDVYHRKTAMWRGTGDQIIRVAVPNDWYADHAKEYTDRADKIDVEHLTDAFLQVIPINKEPSSTRILDVGCGGGRDMLYFDHKGYLVDGVDSCCELVELAVQRRTPRFNIDCCDIRWYIPTHKYQGVWCCASLVHIPRNQMFNAVSRISDCLASGGVAYMSWKYDKSDGVAFDTGRLFTNYTIPEVRELIKQFDELEIISIWKTADARGHDGLSKRLPSWVNVLVKKQ